MRKSLTLAVLLSLACMSASASPQTSLEVETRSYINQSLSDSSSGREMSTGITRSVPTDDVVSGTAASHHLSTLSEFMEDDKNPVQIEPLKDFAAHNGTFKATVRDQMNQQYTNITTGGLGTTKPSDNDGVVVALIDTIEATGVDMDAVASMPSEKANAAKLIVVFGLTAMTEAAIGKVAAKD